MSPTVTMTQQHFEMIADTIAATTEVPLEAREVMALAFADRLALTNTRFKRSLFLRRACPKRDEEE